jgi:hypothetical protein
MFHLDYLSCFLTVLATLLLGRKSWIGLLAAIVNSLLVCLIGLRTSQFGFIPANLFCICIYAFNIRSWQKAQTHTNRDQAQRQASGFIADGAPMSSAKQHRTPCLIHPKEGVPRAHLAPVQACPNGNHRRRTNDLLRAGQWRRGYDRSPSTDIPARSIGTRIRMGN